MRFETHLTRDKLNIYKYCHAMKPCVHLIIAPKL